MNIYRYEIKAVRNNYPFPDLKIIAVKPRICLLDRIYGSIIAFCKAIEGIRRTYFRCEIAYKERAELRIGFFTGNAVRSEAEARLKSAQRILRPGAEYAVRIIRILPAALHAELQEFHIRSSHSVLKNSHIILPYIIFFKILCPRPGRYAFRGSNAWDSVVLLIKMQ